MGIGVNDGMTAKQAAGADGRVAADVDMISDDSAEFGQSGFDFSAIGSRNGDGLVVEPPVGKDGASAQMRFMTEQRISHVVEVGGFTGFEKHAILKLRGIGHDRAVINDDIFADIAAGSDETIIADPGGSKNDGAWHDAGAAAEIDLLTDEGARHDFAETGGFQSGFQIRPDFADSGPDWLTDGKERRVGGLGKIKVSGGGEIDVRHALLLNRDFPLGNLNSPLLNSGGFLGDHRFSRNR